MNRPRKGTGRPLSAAHLAVAALIAEGRSNPEISEILDRACSTVKTHVNAGMRRTGAGDRAELVLLLLRAGLLRFDAGRVVVDEDGTPPEVHEFDPSVFWLHGRVIRLSEAKMLVASWSRRVAA